MKSTGLALAAGAIAAANEVVFAPVQNLPGQSGPANIAANAAASFNWRLIPATGVLVATLAGLEKLSPQFAVGLGALAVMAVLIIPIGKAPTPIDNIIRTLGL